MAPVVTRCGSAGCQHAATGKTCEKGGSCTASSTTAGRGKVAGSNSCTAEGQGRDVAGVTATIGVSTTAHAEEQDDASDAEKHTTFSLQRTAIQLSRNSSAIYTRKTSCDATVRSYNWKRRPVQPTWSTLDRPGTRTSLLRDLTSSLWTCSNWWPCVGCQVKKCPRRIRRPSSTRQWSWRDHSCPI